MAVLKLFPENYVKTIIKCYVFCPWDLGFEIWDFQLVSLFFGFT